MPLPFQNKTIKNKPPKGATNKFYSQGCDSILNFECFLSEELQSDYEIVWTAVSQDWRALRSASSVMQNNRNIVLSAVAQVSLKMKGSWRISKIVSIVIIFIIIRIKYKM
eukprot:4649338-Amphidinium_carterae.1